MRVLIVSCNTGEGHNSCGKAIQEALRARQVPCDMEDAFRFISADFSRLLEHAFVCTYRYLPGLFRLGYRCAEDHPAVFKERSSVYRLLTSGAERLGRFIREGGYDAVICPHVLSALIVSRALAGWADPPRTCFVATDYTCSPSCAQSSLDAYFIPDASLREEFIRSGVPAEKLMVSGIPVRQAFFHSQETEAAKAAWGLPPDCRHLLVMCGSMGCGPIRKLVRRLAPILPENSFVSVVCGTNRRLERKLGREFAGDRRIRIYGYVDQVSSLMDSADLYLTKPGGISVTEAACKGLPMVFVDAVAGCESYNMDFFIQQGGAVTADTPRALAETAAALLADGEQLRRMGEAFPSEPASPAETIAAYILQAKNI